jgi:fructokinase
MPDRSFIMIGLGEILWDLLPEGKQLGGAPANFAYHARALGAEAAPITRVGNDALGREILEVLSALGEPTHFVQVDESAPTGTVTVEMLADGGHRFTIHEGVAWDNITADDANLALASAADAICFGTLAQRSQISRRAVQEIVAASRPESIYLGTPAEQNPIVRRAVQEVAAATRPNALRIFDINLRQHFYSKEVIEQSLRLANALKLNHEELPVVADMFGLTGAPAAQLNELAERFDLCLAALTRGGDGSLLLAGGRISDHPGIPVEVVDSIGAGDAFTAAMALGWLAGWDLDVINQRANEVASYVCGRPGATPALPQYLKSHFANRADSQY